MKFLSIFSESFLSTVRYYLGVDQGLAERFIYSVNAAQEKIVQFPKIGRLVGQYRMLRVKGFPHNFCYCEDLNGELVAIVLFHHRQKEPPRGI